MDVRLLERVMNQKDLAVRIESQNVTIKLNFHEKKIGLREENNLAILTEVEENHRKRKKVKNETNMEIRKNHILAIETLEEEAALVDKIDLEVVEVESTVTDPLEEEVAAIKEVEAEAITVTDLQEVKMAEAEMTLRETEAVEAETSMVTNLLETEEEAEEVEVEAIMEIEAEEARA